MSIHILAGRLSLAGVLIGTTIVTVLEVYQPNIHQYLDLQLLWYFVLLCQICALWLGIYGRQYASGRVGAVGAGIMLLFLLILSLIRIEGASPV